MLQESQNENPKEQLNLGESDTQGQYFNLKIENLFDLQRLKLQLKSDAELIKNRIVLLRKEQITTLKKKKMLDKQRQKLIKIRAYNDQRDDEKRKLQELKEIQISETRTYINRLKEEKKAKDFKINKRIMTQRVRAASQIREKRNEADNYIQDLTKRTSEEKSIKAMKIKTFETKQLSKKKQLEQKIIEKGKKRYQKQMQDLENWKQEREKQLEFYEIEENKFIQKLQNTQQLHLQSKQKLEILKNTPRKKLASITPRKQL